MITSKQNTLIKQIRSLSDKKFRDSLNLYVVEGIKLVNEVISLNLAVKTVICTEKALSKILKTSANVELVSPEVFKSISEEVTPQGALAVVEKPLEKLKKPTGNCLLLDGVSDPANVGAIIRTAACAGYNDVYMTDTCADQYSSKSVRSSMGGVFRVNTYRAKLEELLAVIDNPVVVADMNGEDAFTFKHAGNVCLVIGNEGHGVSESVERLSDYTVKIPMQNGMESLNAAVSAGILMYALKN